MEIAFDPAKNARTLANRGFDFGFAAKIFLGRVVTREDTRRNYGEGRFVAIGEVEGVILAVVYTDRGSVRRIISARPAKKRERTIWQTS